MMLLNDHDPDRPTIRKLTAYFRVDEQALLDLRPIQSGRSAEVLGRGLEKLRASQAKMTATRKARSTWYRTEESRARARRNISASGGPSRGGRATAERGLEYLKRTGREYFRDISRIAVTSHRVRAMLRAVALSGDVGLLAILQRRGDAEIRHARRLGAGRPPRLLRDKDDAIAAAREHADGVTVANIAKRKERALYVTDTGYTKANRWTAEQIRLGNALLEVQIARRQASLLGYRQRRRELNAHGPCARSVSNEAAD
jgi:hypothetical protein